MKYFFPPRGTLSTHFLPIQHFKNDITSSIQVQLFYQSSLFNIYDYPTTNFPPCQYSINNSNTNLPPTNSSSVQHFPISQKFQCASHPNVFVVIHSLELFPEYPIQYFLQPINNSSTTFASRPRLILISKVLCPLPMVQYI